jgi:hypothetical protein
MNKSQHCWQIFIVGIWIVKFSVIWLTPPIVWKESTKISPVDVTKRLDEFNKLPEIFIVDARFPSDQTIIWPVSWLRT